MASIRYAQDGPVLVGWRDVCLGFDNLVWVAKLSSFSNELHQQKPFFLPKDVSTVWGEFLATNII